MIKNVSFIREGTKIMKKKQGNVQPHINDCCVHNADQIKVSDFVQVVDNETNKIVIQGLVQNEKAYGPTTTPRKTDELVGDKKLFSIDNEYYFKLDDTSYTVNKLDSHYINEDFIRQNYKLNSWRRYDERSRNSSNLFIDNTIMELDKEVESIVRTLNEFSPYLSTTGSCSGHKKEPAWVSIRIENSRTFNDFVNVFDPYKHKIELTTYKGLYTKVAHFHGMPFFPRQMDLTLRTIKIGETAYEALNEFDNYLKKIINLRQKSYDMLDEAITSGRRYQKLHGDQD